MSMSTRNPNEPIENLAIGQIIEVDGSRLVAELNPTLSELSRVYAGETYPIGQFGSIIRIHFGRRLVYALVGRLRMKSEFQAERGLVPASSSDERIVEADLFGEGEWVHGASGEWELRFERGVSTYPLPQQTVYLTPTEFDLLAELMSAPGRVFTRGQLLDSVWGYGHAGYEHTVNSHINRLRAKIEADPAKPRYVITVWGVGYKFSGNEPRQGAA